MITDTADADNVPIVVFNQENKRMQFPRHIKVIGLRMRNSMKVQADIIQSLFMQNQPLIRVKSV